MQIRSLDPIWPVDSSLPRHDERYVYHFASEYRDRGWSVIPLHGKRPSIASWKEYQDRRATPNEVNEWFGGDRPAQTCLGIVTGGLSGLIVVDCDCEDGIRFWQDHYPRSPLLVQTGGGGLHIYYRYPEGELIGNRSRIGGHKIDVRATGGYVVAPPSRHASGASYTWTEPNEYCLDQVPMFEPRWLSDLRSPDRTEAFATTINNGAAYIRHIRAVSGQYGHNATFRATCKLRDAGLSPEEALAELVIWNETNADPPWTARELLHKVQSAYRITSQR